MKSLYKHLKMTIDTLKILINTLKNKPKICQEQNFL